jgi:hypothetical protein
VQKGAEDMDSSHKYTNRLAHEHSPYLLQHSHNPVDWYPWGEDAFTKAQAEDKPIFLSVGYSTCHWYVCQNPSFLKASMTFPLVSKLIWFRWIHSSWRNLVPASLLLNEKSCVIPVDGSAIGLY